MKPRPYFLPGILALALASSASGEDTIVLKNGDSRTGQITLETATGLTFKYSVRLSNGQTGMTTRDLPWDSIESVLFAPLPGEMDALAHPEAASEDTLRDLWLARLKHLTRPRSTAPQLGLIYAERLSSPDSRFSRERALEVFTRVESQAWDLPARAQATQGRLQTLIRLGRVDEAMTEARRMAGQAENPAILLEAKYVLASAEFDQLRRLEEENPRWEIDDEIRPLRDSHYHQALDLYLHAYLFHASEDEPAARGLLGAARLYQHTGDLQNALACAGDILRHYPETSSRSSAGELIQQLKSTSASP